MRLLSPINLASTAGDKWTIDRRNAACKHMGCIQWRLVGRNERCLSCSVITTSWWKAVVNTPLVPRFVNSEKNDFWSPGHVCWLKAQMCPPPYPPGGAEVSHWAPQWYLHPRQSAGPPIRDQQPAADNDLQKKNYQTAISWISIIVTLALSLSPIS